jgi:hypothetical protein
MEKRRKTQILEEVKKQFGELSLDFGDPHMDPKRDPGIAGEQIVVKTNIFGIKMNEEWVFFYLNIIFINLKIPKI